MCRSHMMRHMKLSKLVWITVVILLGYMVFQASLYMFLHGNNQNLKNPISKDNEDPQSSQSFKNIENVVTLSHQHGIPLILIDPEVLKKVTNITSPSAEKCHFFCNNHPVTVFGVLSQLWNHNEQFFSSLQDKDFTVTYQKETDWDTLHYLTMLNKAPVYTHYLIQRSHHTIHLVILHERPADYWWHGKLSSTENIDGDNYVTDKSKLISNFVRQGIYSSMEMNKVIIDGLRLRAPRYPLSFLQQMGHSTFIHCNQSQADQYYFKYGTLVDDTQIFRNAAKHILYQAKKTLDHLGIRFWLSSGTCLGWYRQCDTIPYSGDVDIGIWIKDYKSELIPAMKYSGLTLKHLFGKESDSFELSLTNGDLKLDIFFFYEEFDHMWNGGTQTKTGKKFKYIFPKFTLCWTEFLGMTVRVPCDPKTYVTANYGENWFEPVKTWDWKKSPSNVKPNGKWPEAEWDKVIVSFE